MITLYESGFESPIFGVTEERLEGIKKLLGVRFIIPTGSRHTEAPPKLGTDDDYVCYLEDNHTDDFRPFLVTNGWVDCLFEEGNEASRQYQEEQVASALWGAFRNGEVNLIVCENLDLFLGYLAGTKICTLLNIKDKDRRVRIFRWAKLGNPLDLNDLKMDES